MNDYHTPASVSLEQRVMAGNIWHLHPPDVDRENGRLTLRFCGWREWKLDQHVAWIPDDAWIVRTLTFIGIREFVEARGEPEDPNFLECLIGIHEIEEVDGVRYDIQLMDVAFCFVTADSPQLIELAPPTAPSASTKIGGE